MDLEVFKKKISLQLLTLEEIASRASFEMRNSKGIGRNPKHFSRLWYSCEQDHTHHFAAADWGRTQYLSSHEME